MTQELQNALLVDFPKLYAQYNDPMSQTCMCWGFECGDGWAKLIRTISEALSKIDVQAVQVKEKFGTLRFYVGGPDWAEADKILHELDTSHETCEECGNIGSMHYAGYWMKTLCKECAEKIGNYYPATEVCGLEEDNID